MSTPPMRVWRCETLSPEGWRYPPATRVSSRRKWLTGAARGRVTVAACDVNPQHAPLDPQHAPPVLECTCGIHGVQHAADLAMYVKALEYNRARAIADGFEEDHRFIDPLNKWLDEPAARQRQRQRQFRIIIVHGELDDPLPVDNHGRHYLQPLWSDGSVGYNPRGAAGHLKLSGLLAVNDPPGTWRGSRFTMTGPVIVQSRPDDRAEAYGDIFGGIEHHLVPEVDVDSLLSRRLERYAAAGRDDGEWWTDEPPQ